MIVAHRLFQRQTDHFQLPIYYFLNWDYCKNCNLYPSWIVFKINLLAPSTSQNCKHFRSLPFTFVSAVSKLVWSFSVCLRKDNLEFNEVYLSLIVSFLFLSCFVTISLPMSCFPQYKQMSVGFGCRFVKMKFDPLG